HVGGAFRPTQHCSQRDDNDVEQIVTGIGRPRVRQASEEPLEFLHWTPPAIRESPSESMLLADATSLSNPHAIPLPHKGGREQAVLAARPCPPMGLNSPAGNSRRGRLRASRTKCGLCRRGRSRACCSPRAAADTRPPCQCPDRAARRRPCI